MSEDKCPICKSNLRQLGWTLVCDNCSWQKDI